jgi:hypothetical protein
MDSTMKERPILFNAAMVNAILAGNKTQTRRVMKPQPTKLPPDSSRTGHWWPSNKFQTMLHVEDTLQNKAGGWLGLAGDACPLGDVGDRLWVRESFYIGASMHHHTEKNSRVYVEYKPLSPNAVKYGHHGESKECMRPLGEVGPCQNTPTFRRDGSIRWRPSIHMPRWASRITLEITAVRVERLRDISEEDALAEGVRTEQDTASEGAGWYDKPRRAFQFLWSSIYGDESWGANPWVWVIEFKRISP